MTILFRALFALQLLAIALPAAAQTDCRCCKMRSEGQDLFNKGRYAEAKTKWKAAKGLSDAKEKCKNLDSLVAKPVPKPKPKSKPKQPKKQVLKPKKTFVFDYPMERVEGGRFMMGSPAEEGGRFDNECQHEVSVRSFSMGKYEVTQAQWKAVMGKNPSELKNDNFPVENVTWYDVQKFIKQLNVLTNKRYRLPMESEWEFAARGGTKSLGYIFAGSNNITDVANDASPYYGLIGTKKANELGIYDMSGNVLEWCQDNYKPYRGCLDHDDLDDDDRVIRGDGPDNPGGGRVCSRNYRSANSTFDVYLGFRLAHD